MAAARLVRPPLSVLLTVRLTPYEVTSQPLAWSESVRTYSVCHCCVAPEYSRNNSRQIQAPLELLNTAESCVSERIAASADCAL